MDKLLFGISGLPIGDGSKKFNYKSGIEYLSSIGLDAMEFPFVRSVNVTDKNKDGILEIKKKKDFYVSAHGSYYINLNSDDQEKQEQSLERILKGADGLKKAEGRSLVFHPGFYLSDTPEETYRTIAENLKRLPDTGVTYRLETTGKGTQFGTIEEIVALSSEIKTCAPCIDFSHIHARYNGSLKTYDDFMNILQLILTKLGKDYIEDLHIHISGINYGLKGEKNHLPLEESDFNFTQCMRALKDIGAKGCIICESPILEKDALLLKETYAKI